VGTDHGSSDRFEWNTERYHLTIWLEADEWWIQHTTPNPLLGPMVIAEARHKQAKQAVWDVLSRVTKATRDDEEGVRSRLSRGRSRNQVGEQRVARVGKRGKKGGGVGGGGEGRLAESVVGVRGWR